MELHFLGQAYLAGRDRIETEALEQTASFRGQKYNLRRPIQTNKSQLGLRKYRGVTYGA